MPSEMHGLIVATLTPFDKSGELNLAQVRPFTDRLIGLGVEGLFACGTTGESSSLTTAERKAVTEAYADANAGRVPLAVHVGHTCLKDAQDLAAHAADLGADAIAALAPYYLRPRNVSALVDVLAAIADAAPGLPLYYYHIPSMSGMQLDLIDLLKEADKRLPTLAGAKFTYEDLMDYRDCLAHADGKYSILFGRDEMLLSGLAMGAPGGVGATYNVLLTPYRRLREAFEAGDMETARAEQMAGVKLVRLMRRFGGIPTLKTIVRRQGIDMGPPRLPLQALTETEEAELMDGLAGVDGVF